MGLSLGEKGEPICCKAQVLNKVDGDAMIAFAKQTVQPGTVVLADGLNIYCSLSTNGYVHQPKKVDSKNAPENLKWLHTIVSKGVDKKR